MARRRDPAPRIHLPPGMRYECVQCGHGCSAFWEVPVDPEAEEKLLRYDLEQYQQVATGEAPFRDSDFDEGERTLTTVEDRCTFLCDDNKCALHAALGPKEKPQACIDFPFRYVDTPAGPFVGLSFACTAVLQDHGPPVADRGEELAENFTESVHYEDARKRVQLTGRIDIDFDAYLEIERAFGELLDISGVPLPRRMLAQSMFMDTVVEAFKAARLPGEAPVELTAEEQNAAESASDAAIVVMLANRYRVDGWGRLLARAARANPNPPLHRAVVGLVTTYRRMLWRGSNRARALATISAHYLLHALGRGQIRLAPVEPPLRYRDLARRWPDAEPGSTWDALMTRWMRHSVFRKDLLLAEDVRSGHRGLLLTFAIANWYMAACAARDGSERPTVEHEREGVRLTETYYVYHGHFAQYLERQPLVGTMLDTVLSGPRFAGSITGLPLKQMAGERTW